MQACNDPRARPTRDTRTRRGRRGPRPRPAAAQRSAVSGGAGGVSGPWRRQGRGATRHRGGRPRAGRRSDRPADSHSGKAPSPPHEHRRDRPRAPRPAPQSGTAQTAAGLPRAALSTRSHTPSTPCGSRCCHLSRPSPGHAKPPADGTCDVRARHRHKWTCIMHLRHLIPYSAYGPQPVTAFSSVPRVCRLTTVCRAAATPDTLDAHLDVT